MRVALSQVPASKDDTNPSGYANFTDAVSLIANVISYMKTPTTANQICETVRNETGITWSQRFKPQHGTFMKFMRRHPEVFVIDGMQKVSLNPDYVFEDILEKSFVSQIDVPNNDTSSPVCQYTNTVF